MKRCLLLVILFALLRVPVMAQTAVTLAWDANTDTNLAGYKIYWGTASRTYGTPAVLGKVTTYKVTGLPCGVNLFFAATAYDTSTPPMESGYSNEPTIKLLCAPVNLKITATSVTGIQRKEVTLLAQTNEPSSMTITYRGVEGTFARTVSSTPSADHTVRLTSLRPHSTYSYTLTAYVGAEQATSSGTFTTQ
jgi:hypothetical protein